jgi:hypothetical protein
MLRETIAAGIKMGSIRPAQLKRINVNTTVQTKADPLSGSVPIDLVRRRIA